MFFGKELASFTLYRLANLVSAQLPVVVSLYCGCALLRWSVSWEIEVMKFSMAEFWGMVTLLTATFAALRYLVGSPAAVVGIIIVSVPMHVMVCELVERMTKSNKGRNRIN